MPQTIVKNTRVNEIDLLRFLAVMAVVIHHYAFRGYAADDMSVMPYPLLAPIAQYGYLGVHLFFTISGFVILMTAGSGDLRKFIVSRIARLYPAFWVCCTITFIATLIIGGTHYHATVTQYLANMTMLSGFIGVESIEGAYWSLFIEMQFYAFVAIVLVKFTKHSYF
jgi:peptidoglycan/LPS O-acetylase OafA/YrhL